MHALVFSQSGAGGQAFPFLLQEKVLVHLGYSAFLQLVQFLHPLLPSKQRILTHYSTHLLELSQVGPGQALPFLLQEKVLVHLG